MILGHFFTLVLVETFNFLHKCFLICILRLILYYAITLFWAPSVVPLQYLTPIYSTMYLSSCFL